MCFQSSSSSPPSSSIRIDCKKEKPIIASIAVGWMPLNYWREPLEICVKKVKVSNTQLLKDTNTNTHLCKGDPLRHREVFEELCQKLVILEIMKLWFLRNCHFWKLLHHCHCGWQRQSKLFECWIWARELKRLKPKVQPNKVSFSSRFFPNCSIVSSFMSISDLFTFLLNIILDHADLPKLFPGHPGLASPPDHNLPLPLPPSQQRLPPS